MSLLTRIMNSEDIAAAGGLLAGNVRPTTDFISAIKSNVQGKKGPIFVNPLPGLYKWNGYTAPGSGALLTLNDIDDVTFDWSGTKWQFLWDVRNPDPTIRSEIDHVGGNSVQHLNIDRDMVPSPFTQGVVKSSTATSLRYTYDPGFAPLFFDAAYCQSRTNDRLTVKDRQFDEDGNISVISPIRALGTRVSGSNDGFGLLYTSIDSSNAPIDHGLTTGDAITILGERGCFTSEGQSAVNGENRYTADVISPTTFRLKDLSGVTLTSAGLTPPAPGIPNGDGSWDGPVISNGDVDYYARPTTCPVTAVTVGSPVALTLGTDMTPGHQMVLNDGGYVVLNGTGLKDSDGNSIDGIQYIALLLETADGDGIAGIYEIFKDDGDTPVKVTSTVGWTGGTVTNVAFPGSMSAVGTPVAISCRKHATGGLAFLGTKYVKVSGRSRASVGVLLTGIANETFDVGDFLSEGKPGALLSAGAGTLILNDLRTSLRIRKLECNGAADDVLNVVYKWWRPLTWPLQNGGSDYITGDFAPANSRTGKPSAPRVGDTGRVFDGNGNPVAVCLVTGYNATTKRVDFATGSLPAGFNPATGWTIRPYSAVARWSVDTVKGRGLGARLVVCTGAYPVIDNLVAIGNRKYVIRCNNPASGAHATNGSFDGGLHIGNFYIADGMLQDSNMTCAIQMRRFNPSTGVVATPRSDYAQSSIGNLRAERIGYGLGQIHWNLRIDSFSFEKLGYLRTGGTVGVASKDFTVEGCTLSIGQVSGDRALVNATANSGVITIGT